jgi:hypothetical protein
MSHIFIVVGPTLLYNGAACLSRLRASISTLTNPVFVKAALALLNVHYTFHTHAVFSNI